MRRAWLSVDGRQAQGRAGAVAGPRERRQRAGQGQPRSSEALRARKQPRLADPEEPLCRIMLVFCCCLTSHCRFRGLELRAFVILRCCRLEAQPKPHGLMEVSVVLCPFLEEVFGEPEGFSPVPSHRQPRSPLLPGCPPLTPALGGRSWEVLSF